MGVVILNAMKDLKQADPSLHSADNVGIQDDNLEFITTIS